MLKKERLIVIGNGMAGARFVEELVARDGAEMYDIVMFGEESCGNYNRILLSSVLAGAHRPEDTFINNLSWYEEQGIKLYSGVKAGWIDRMGQSVYAAGGISESYDKLVIATGSTPFLPPVESMHDEDGFLRSGVFSFRTLEDCQAMIDHAATARRAVVIGGGLLGLEAARGLLERHLEVHIAHLGGHLMNGQLDAPAGAMLKETLEDLGLNIHLDKLAVSVTPPFAGAPVGGLKFKDGEELECDMIVVAAGVRPNIDLARQAGLHVQHGIVIQDDLSCRNDRNIYAIGECAQHRGKLFGLVAPLWEQARILAEQLTGENPEASFRGVKLSTKLKVLGVDLAIMGDKDPQTDEDEQVHYSEPARGVYKKLIVRNGRLAGAILLGDGLTAPGVLQAFDRGELLPENRAGLLFPGAGVAARMDVAELPDTAQVCNCNGVTKGRIIQVCQQGQSTLEAVCAATRAGSGCGACKPQVKAIVAFEANRSASQSATAISVIGGKKVAFPTIENAGPSRATVKVSPGSS
ncbi:MAG: FAD-dependent oxidoreductase [Chloroflexota bacterium]|nr:FAD-dependent oxidoreductase [Chloroflexota bacterium]